MSLQVRGKGAAELDTGGIDSAAAAVKDGGLPVPELSDHEDVEECGDVRFADAGRLFEAHAVGNPHEVAGIGHGVFGVAATPHEGDDPVPLVPSGDAGSEFLDNPGDLQAEDLRISRRGRVLSFPLHQVGAVDRRCHDLDEHLVLCRRRFFCLADGEHLQSAESVQEYRFHRESSFNDRLR